MKEFEIYFRDLNEEAQQALLKTAGIERQEDANWDIFPITTVYIEDGDDSEDDETHDYILNVGDEFDNLDPKTAYTKAEEAIVEAKRITETTGQIAEVVYMPEDDIDTNEVIYRTSLERGIEDFRDGTADDSETDYEKITEIIRSAWQAELDAEKEVEKKGYELQEDMFEFYIWKSYIAAFGYQKAQIDAYAERHKIECDEDDQDPFDEESIPGSLIITKKVIERITNNK